MSKEENSAVFGKCCNFHGHNYDLEVVIRGEVNPKTGMVINITDLKHIIEDRVLKLVDHRNLDVDVDFFKTNPS